MTHICASNYHPTRRSDVRITHIRVVVKINSQNIAFENPLSRSLPIPKYLLGVPFPFAMGHTVLKSSQRITGLTKILLPPELVLKPPLKLNDDVISI